MVMRIECDVLEFNTKSLKFLIVVNEHHIMADDNCMPYIMYEKQNEAMRCDKALYSLCMCECVCVCVLAKRTLLCTSLFSQNMSNTMKHCFVAMINYKIQPL